MESHNNQKKIAVINDLTGFGRCALTVAIPVISVMGLACCPVPTSILSNHTAFPSCFIDDYTEKMEPYINEWKKLGLVFDGIYSGFLGSREQIAIVKRFFQSFRKADTQIIIDPVMGDNGKPYRTYTVDMCQAMKELVCYGSIVTPNVTEACILTDTPYKEQWSEAQLEALARKLVLMGPKKVVITGVEMPDGSIGNYCLEQPAGALSEQPAGRTERSAPTVQAPAGEPDRLLVEPAAGALSEQLAGRLLTIERAGKSRCGTGDLFASIIAADAVNGVALEASVRKAAAFVAKTIRASEAEEIPLTDGVCFEYFLSELAPERV